MFCPNCGNKLPEDAGFCPNCGGKIEREAAKPPTPAEPPAQPPRPTEHPAEQPQEPAAAAPPQPAAPPRQPAPPSPEAAPRPQQPPPAATAPTQPSEPAPPAQPPTTTPAAPGPAQPPSKKKGATCWIVGCIVFFGVAVIGGGAIFFGLRYARSKAEDLKEQIEQQMPLDIQTGDEEGDQGEGGDESGTSTETDADAGSGEVSLSDLGEGVAQGLGQALEEMQGQIEEAQAEAQVSMATATLNAFLEAQGNGDGYAMQNFLTPELKKDFMPEIWGQGDSEHKGWNVVNQQQISSDTIQFEVEETLHDHADNTTYTDRWVITMEWDGDRWLVAQHDLVQ